MYKQLNKKIWIGLTFALVVALIGATFAFADNVENNLVTTPPSITLTAGDPLSYWDVDFWIQPNSNDGDQKCNFDTDAEKVTFTINTPTGVIANPSSLTFNKCHDGNDFNEQSVRFSADASAESGNVSFTQTFNNSGGTFNYADAVFYVNVVSPPPSDSTPPTITFTLSGNLGSNGWYTSSVGVVWTVTDNESSLLSTNGCEPTTIDYETPTVTLTCSATSAGGTNSESVSVKVDMTGPSAVLAVTGGDLGANGWYTSDVTVSTSGSDDVSGPAVCTADQFQTDETAGNEFNGSCTNGAGLTTDAAPLTVMLDKTGPSAALAVTAGTLGANGWYTSDVTVSTTGSDDVSGPVNCTADQFQTLETTGFVFNGSCTNGAGLTTNATPLTVKLDQTGPSAALAVTAGTSGSNGWYTSDVTVSTSGSDDVSGPVNCTADQFQTTETAGAEFKGSCTNDAGLTTNAAPLTVKLDRTGPSAQLNAVGTLGNNGWYVSDVTINTSGSDTISNPTTCSDVQYQTADTSGTTFIGSCTNDAGLSTNAASLTIKRDATPPSLAWVGGPDAGGTYYFGFVPAAPNCTASDSLSGPDGCTVTGYGTLVGSHTMTAKAFDVAGNSYSEERTYTVNAWTLKGFYQPVDMNGVYNLVKGGSTVPLKFEVFAGTTELTSTTVVKSFVQTKVACDGTAPTDEIELTTTGGTSLRYDATAGQFIQNWQTPKAAGTCYRVTMTTQDNSSLVAFFKLK